MDQAAEEQQSQFIVKLVFLAFFMFGVFATTRYLFGNKIIGHWFEKPGEYTTQYWVYLEPSSSSTKNYRVKGEIEKLSLGEEEGWGYYLRTVDWNNGGNTDFDECQISEIKGDYCIDFDGNGYVVRLGESAN